MTTPTPTGSAPKAICPLSQWLGDIMIKEHTLNHTPPVTRHIVFLNQCSFYILVQSSNRSARIMSIFRKHKIVQNLKIATVKQVISHLSKLLKFIFRKSHYVLFGQKMESTLPKYPPSVWPLLIIPCIGHSESHFLPFGFEWNWFVRLKKKGIRFSGHFLQKQMRQAFFVFVFLLLLLFLFFVFLFFCFVFFFFFCFVLFLFPH